MSTSARQRFAAAVLALLVAWPPMHHVLVRRFEMDPWAFFGFAMYAVPNLGLNVRGAVAPEPGGLPDWNSLPPDVRKDVHAFALRRERFGQLLRPDSLAQEIFARHPDLPGVAIRVRRFVLERETARIGYRDRDYRYAGPSERSFR